MTKLERPTLKLKFGLTLLGYYSNMIVRGGKGIRGTCNSFEYKLVNLEIHGALGL